VAKKKKQKVDDFFASMNMQNPPRPRHINWYIRNADETSNPKYTILGYEFTMSEEVDSFGVTEGPDPNYNFRACLLPEENAYWVSRDFSGQELRILTNLANEPIWINTFLSGGDIHGETAKLLWGEENFSVDLRKRAKAINFGIVYGIGPVGLSKRLNITGEEAQLYIDKYFEKLPNIEAYLNNNVKIASRNMSLSNYYGRPRRFSKYKNNYGSGISSRGENIAYNFPIQSLGADITKLALIKVYYNIIDNPKYIGKVYFLNTIHDEINLSVDKDIVEEVVYLMGQEMEHNIPGTKVPIISEIAVGNSMGLLFDFEQDLETKKLTPIYKPIERSIEDLPF